MQMGPALLPTPLSPARGHPLLAMRPANLPHPPRQGMLGARCLASRCLRLAAGPARDLSPALAPASGFRSCPAAPFRSPKPPMFAALRSRLAETVSLYRSGLAAAYGLASFTITRSGQVPGLSGDIASLLPQTSRLAFGRSLLHALSRQARGQIPPPSLGSKPRKLQGLAAFRSGCFVSRRQVESAPQPAFWQHFTRRLFHFRPFRLWTRVDKSTLRRICREPGERAGTKPPSECHITGPLPPQRARRLGFPHPLGRVQASRLRRASSRRRNPFSLMKPSASFWS